MKSNELKNELNELQDFLQGKTFSASEIIRWVSSCVAFFSSINMNESIISGFMGTFANKAQEIKNNAALFEPSRLGPFTKNRGNSCFILDRRDLFSPDRIFSDMVYIQIAFTTAENILNSLEDSERLVPKSLIKSFSEKPEYSQIFSSLELLQQNFEARDSVGLASNGIALLGSLLNLEPSIKGKDLSAQLRKLQSDHKLRIKFGVRKEIICALDNSRILRNYLATHKAVPIEYDIPFSVSLGGAYLVIMFLQITMATGEVIK